MTSVEKQRKRLIELLKELFQLNQPDLDFGFYRIMHAKADQVSKFLEEDLLSIIRNAFGEIDESRKMEAKAAYEATLKQAKDFGVFDPEATEPVQKAKAAFVTAKDAGSNEGDIYDHLYRFFERYYDNGDFMSLRYFARETDGRAAPYAVPYDGREMYLHWANRDQYYIKTSEHLTNFTFDPTQAKEFKTYHGELFKGKPLKVHCRIVSADEGEHSNIKATEQAERYFIIHKKEPLKLESGNDGETNLVIQLEYRIDPEKSGQEGIWRKRRLKEATIIIKEVLSMLSGAGDFETALLTPSPTEKEPSRTLLEKYLFQYTARNTMDYFIHKDLGGFLRRELDFYIKNEIMHLDDIDTADVLNVSTYLDKIKVLRTIARHLIDFLAQLEEFQKKLWLKQSFAYETRYLISVSEIPKKFHKTILENSKQVEEWKTNLNFEFNTKLEQYPNLLIDTIYFDDKFTETVLSEIENLEEKTDGVLFGAENFSVINFISKKFEEKIDTIYIDPPYNSDASAILYKNNYKNSSWCSLVADRIYASTFLLKQSGIFCAAIDDEQVSELKWILSSIMSKNLGMALVRSNPQSRKSRTTLSPSHEYALFFAKSSKTVPGSLGMTEKRLARYPQKDEKGNFSWMNFIRTGTNDKRTDRPKLFYPIFVDKNNELRIPKMKWIQPKNGLGYYNISDKLKLGEVEVYPTTENDGRVIEKCWQRGHKRVIDEIEEYRVRRGNDGKLSIDFKTRIDKKSTPTTWWDKNEYASANYGAAELKQLFGTKIFDFPKAVTLVEDCLRASSSKNDVLIFDYFAGSGTTAHAVMNLNREDNGTRKFILAEMGTHYEEVIVPRIKKVTYSPKWEDGKPQIDILKGSERTSRIFKLLYLESYEDTLFNLKHSKILDTPSYNKNFCRDYMLRYWLDVETKDSPSLLNIKNFDNPTAYTLKVKKAGTDEYVEKAVDIIETFNWLIGLYVEHLDRWRGYDASFEREKDPELPEDTNTRLILDGNLKETNDGSWQLRKIEGYVIRTPSNHSDRERVLVIWRKLTDNPEQDNLVLDEWFKKYRLSAQDSEFDIIYVNGSNNLPNLRQAEETWKVRLIEEAFHQAIWNVKN